LELKVTDFLKKQNNSKSVLLQTASSSDTVITVFNPAVFPSSPFFLVTIWDKETFSDPSDDPKREILKVTNINGNIFTVIRAQEHTNANLHLAGSAVEMLITAGHFTEIEGYISQLMEGTIGDNSIISTPSGDYKRITEMRYNPVTEKIIIFYENG